jgi:Zn-dependent protease with chaperone function
MAPYSGSFNDGRSAARQEVSVRLDLSGLRILGPDGREVARWPYEALRLLDEDLGTRSLRLKCGEEGAARLTLADRRLLADLAAYAPQLARTRRGHPGLLRALGLGALGLFVFLALVWVVVPRMAEWTAGLIPVSWEEALGERAMEQTLEVLSALGEGRPRSCAGPAGQAALERLSARLAAAMDATADAPYRFQVSVLDFKMANAFALPGGRIVFFGELIGQAESPDEVAGVLAHEMGHVSRRHGTQALLRSLGLEVLFGLLLGDLGEGLFGSLGAAMLSHPRGRPGRLLRAPGGDRPGAAGGAKAALDPPQPRGPRAALRGCGRPGRRRHERNRLGGAPGDLRGVIGRGRGALADFEALPATPYSNASSQVPRVAAREYSVARFSKKLVCSTPFRMASSQVSGFFSIR